MGVSFLGGNAPTAGQGYFGQARGLLGQNMGIGQQYGELAAGQLGRYRATAPMADAARQSYADLLQRGTTDQDRAREYARYLGNIDRQGIAGQASLNAGLQGEPDNSMSAGLRSAYAAQMALGRAGAMNNAYDALRQRQMGQAGQLYGLQSGAEQQFLGQGQGLLGAQGGLNAQTAGMYNDMGQYADQMQMAAQQQGINNVMGLAQLGGTLGGMGAFNGLNNAFRARPAAVRANPQWGGSFSRPGNTAGNASAAIPSDASYNFGPRRGLPGVP